MNNALILLEKFDSIAVVRFNNPREKNPLSVAVLQNLETVLTDLIPKSRAIIFTGDDEIFASGANLREIAALKTEMEIRKFGLHGQNLMRKIADAKCLTIAAINGFCMGGAFDLALACRIRIAAPNAVFAHPGANLGIMTAWGGTQRLPQLVGEAAALEMFLTAKRVGAVEALKIGLIDEIAERTLEKAVETAKINT